MSFPRPFEPDPGALLERLAVQVDDGMLHDIAEADYGMQAKDHEAVLRPMRDSGFVPEAGWVPQEVLELIRWSEPDEPGWKPGGQGARGHRMRAFCCASLLRMAGEKDMGAHVSFNETVAGLVASLDALDTPFWAEAGSFLVWFMERMAETGSRAEEPFLGTGLLYCALHAAAVPDLSIVALCRWTVSREEAEAQEPMGTANDYGWLHRISFHDLRRETWKRLGGKMAALDLRRRSGDVRDWVELIGTSLAGDR
jgi:hypothetical protein